MIDFLQHTDGGESGISEAASEIESAKDQLRALIPPLPAKVREEREKWKAPKVGPGRPRMVRDEYHPSKPIDQYHKEDLGHSVGSKAKTGRGRQEAQYACWAMRAIFEHRERHPEVLELTGLAEHSEQFGREQYPGIVGQCKNIGILAELGRLICKYGNGEEAAVEWAVELVKMRPRLTSKQAVAWLRQRRLQKTNLGNSEGVLRAITGGIDTYLASHPGTSPKAIVQALHSALWMFDEELTEEYQGGDK